MRSRLIWSAAILIGLLLSAEIGLRAIVGLGNPPLFQSDPEVGYLMVANQEVYRLGTRIKINAFHQRSDDLAPLPAPGVIRYFFLGDSITFGITGVDQTQIYPELVGSAQRQSGEKIEIMDASAVSWGIGNELAYVRRFGTFGSKIAILEIGSADLLQPTSVGDGVGVNASQPARKPISAISELLERVLLPRLKDMLGMVDASNEPVTPADRDLQYDENMKHFADLVAAVRKQGSSPLVVLMPGLAELVPPESPGLSRYQPYRARFRQYAAGLGLPLLDIADKWRGDANNEAYYVDGTHLTVAGNEALAREIVAAIKRM